MERHKYGDPEFIKQKNKLIPFAAKHADEIIGGPPTEEELAGLSVRGAKRIRMEYGSKWTICFLEEMKRLSAIYIYKWRSS